MAKKTKKPFTVTDARAAWPELAKWWDAAKANGTIYARADASRSNMSGTVLLWTIVKHEDREPTFETCWPFKDGDKCAAKFGFSLKARAFKVGGCGFDRVHHVVSTIAWFMDGTERFEPRIETLNRPE